MGDAKARLVLELDPTRFTGGTKTAEAAISSFGSKAGRAMSGIGRGMDALDRKIGGVGGALAMLAGGYGMQQLVNNAMDASYRLARLGVQTGMSREQLLSLKNAAYDVAKALPGIAPTDLIEAASELSRQGMPVEQIISNLQLVGQTAVITGASVGLVADIVDRLGDSWGTNTADAKALATALDQMATAAAKGDLRMENMPTLLSKSALAAKAAGATMPEYLALANTIASVTKSADAAEPVMSKLFALLGKKEGIKALASIGIKTSDAKGKMRPFLDVLGELATKLQGTQFV